MTPPWSCLGTLWTPDGRWHRLHWHQDRLYERNDGTAGGDRTASLAALEPVTTRAAALALAQTLPGHFDASPVWA